MHFIGFILFVCVLLRIARKREWALGPVLAVVGVVALVTPSLTVLVGSSAQAATASVPLGTAGTFSVLAASTVTNTGPSSLDGSLGLSPGSAITGFPPGIVVPPSNTENSNAVALQAQSDLNVAYNDAAGRPVNTTTTSDLGGLHLMPGVYSGPGKSSLAITGPLVLDGAGDSSSVFIFQTSSTLITGTGSTVTLINGAQECHVFW